jgi:hypothetical protein
MPAILEKELDTFEANKERLLATAEGQYALISGDQVIGTYSSDEDAISEGYRRFLDKPFLVKRIQRVETPMTFFASFMK